MAIPRRLRFEILRRDHYRCRYCGAAADDTTLVVDHVLPEALGGLTEAANLVSACTACNSGKSSVAPDQPLVEEVAQDAERWTRAIEVVAKWRSEHHQVIAEACETFEQAWDDWSVGAGKGKKAIPRPSDWETQVIRFLELGLSPAALVRFVNIAMGAQHVHLTETWTYFCGCCWTEIRLIQKHATRIVRDEERGL